MHRTCTSTSTKQGFDSLLLPPALREAVRGLGWHTPSDVQQSALPAALSGKDIIAQAMTGSGKTAAFALPLLARLIQHTASAPVAATSSSALVLCPTRELAGQVAAEIRRLARCLPNTRVLTLVGGEPRRAQIKALRAPPGSLPSIVVGTPGRVNDHIESGVLDLSLVSTLVLDEADRMLDMGFRNDLALIAAACGSPDDRQTLLFSATYSDPVRELSKRFMRRGDRNVETITTQVKGADDCSGCCS